MNLLDKVNQAFGRIKELEAERDELKAKLEAMEQALTRNGKLVPYHLETWADSIRNQNGYSGANLEVWLRDVAVALAAAQEPE